MRFFKLGIYILFLVDMSSPVVTEIQWHTVTGKRFLEAIPMLLFEHWHMTFSTVLKCLWLMTHPQGLEVAQVPLLASTLAMALLFQRAGQPIVWRGLLFLPWPQC